MAAAPLVDAVVSSLEWDGWRAIAALATFLAVVVALRRDVGAERRSCRQEAAILHALVNYVATAQYIFVFRFAKLRGRRSEETLQEIDQEGHLKECAEGILAFKVADFSDPYAIQQLAIVKLAVKRLLHAAENPAKYSRKNVAYHVSGLRSTGRALRRHRDRLAIQGKDWHALRRWSDADHSLRPRDRDIFPWWFRLELFLRKTFSRRKTA